VATGILRLFGFRIEGEIPAVSRCVAIVAPHTSNWDFPLCIFAMFAIGLRLTFLGKHTLFRFPVKGLLRWFGGEPLDRSAASGQVRTAITRFATHKPWILGVSPEGTRKRVEPWKLGFYRIAVGAGVPIVTVSLDYSRRLFTIAEPFWPTHNERDDLRALQSRFSKEMALYPEKFAESGLTASLPPSTA
jgi:1-acyl-sn-glycerol-3-phosphate acyltransferase